jgi:HNH endonuclease
MVPRKLPPRRVLNQLFIYDHDTGALIRRTAGRAIQPFPSRHDYVFTSVAGYRFRVHRIIWKMVTGREPPARLDHINRDGTDNRFDNLRRCTNSQNGANSRNKRGGKSLRGTVFDRGAWKAQIRVLGKNRHLGRFPTEAAAHTAYVAAGRKAFGKFFHPG